MADPQINVKIGGDSSGLHRELGRSQQGVMGFASSLKSLASSVGLAFSVGTLINFGRNMLQAADATKAYADALGIPIESLVALQRSAASFGTSGDKVLQWLQKLQDASDKISTGQGRDLERWLGALGISSKAFVEAPVDRKLEMLMKAADGAAEGVGALNAMLGRGAASEAKEGFEDLAKNGLDPLIAKYAEAGAAAAHLAEMQGRIEKTQADVGTFFLEGTGAALKEWDRYSQAIEERFKDDPGWIKFLKTGFGYSMNQVVYGATLGRVDLGANLPGARPVTGGATTTPPASGPSQAYIDARNRAIDAYNAEEFQASYQRRLKQMTMKELMAESAVIESALQASIWDQSITGEQVEQMRKNRKMINKVIEDVNKEMERIGEAAADYREKRQGIIDKAYAQESEVNFQYAKDIAGVTAPLPRLSGIESLGGSFGASGGYALTVVGVQRQIADLQAKALASLQNVDKNTADALKALEGP